MHPIKVGNYTFPSRDAAFQFYNINRKTYHSRIAGGWDPYFAMVVPVGMKP